MPSGEFADSQRNRRLRIWLLAGVGIVFFCLFGIWIYRVALSTVNGDSQSGSAVTVQAEIEEQAESEPGTMHRYSEGDSIEPAGFHLINVSTGKG